MTQQSRGYIQPMPEELTTAVELPFRHRVRHGVRKPHNWLQLARFAAVGASGYVVNLVVFAVCVHLLGIDYQLAAVVGVRGLGPEQLLVEPPLDVPQPARGPSRSSRR